MSGDESDTVAAVTIEWVIARENMLDPVSGRIFKLPVDSQARKRFR